MPDANLPSSIRFGPFVLDLASGDLLRDGRSTRLPEQQFQILQMLLFREGGVISREEIRKKLWPNDRIVEFDRSINAAIMKLRSALGETAEDPSFIETVARRGYRLLVSVQVADRKILEALTPVSKNGSLVGQKVLHYRVLGVLGGGGMGLVYEAEDLKLTRPVALKFLPEEVARDAVTLQRFEREARTASSLNHPNICTIYQVEEHENHPFIVMELLEGKNLRALIAEFSSPLEGKQFNLPLHQLLDLAIQIAEGLDAAHQKGIIHRDIKPANIFVTPRGQVKILDFGLAKVTESRSDSGSGPDKSVDDHSSQMATVPGNAQLSNPGCALGTIAYMSPEQARGEQLDARSDLFSFGIVLYEMTTGKHPFGGPTVDQVSEAIQFRRPKAPSAISPAIPVSLEQIIERLMEKDPVARYSKAREVADQLQAIQQQQRLSRWNLGLQEIPSIAVLPFEDLSPDRSQQPFCEGMAAEIINALGGVQRLRVMSRTSSVRCREKGMDLSEIGQHLGVQSVLEGTVRKSGSRLRVTAQLVSTKDGSQSWSERYDRNEGDVFDIQDEIASAIVKNLKVRLVDSAPGVRRSTQNLEAYKMYLKGRYYWERRNRASLQSAMTYFQQAIAADPEYALPHSGLADCFMILAVYSIKSHQETYPQALKLAKRALELDPDLPEGHLSLGAIQLLIEHDWAGAEASLTRALELDPKLAVARGYRSFVFATRKEWQRAKSEVMLTVADEPDSGLISYLAAAAMFWSGDLDTAAEFIERALDLEPKAILIHWIRSWIFSLRGRAEEAISENLRAAVASDHHQMLVAGLGVGYAQAGRTAEAEELIAELKSRSAQECIASQWIGEIYLAMGRYDDALDYFERGFEEGNSFLLALAAAPHYAQLRDEPRYQTLVKKLNLKLD
jgi:serine/threonine protein kinase/Tfp pilus assembly protein PilF